MGNYPAGVTDADFYDQPWEMADPEPTDEELEAEYLDRLEQEAEALPPYDFSAEVGADFVWTDADIAEYERRLALRDADPRMSLDYEEARRAAA
jgi:hypothetical protein